MFNYVIIFFAVLVFVGVTVLLPPSFHTNAAPFTVRWTAGYLNHYLNLHRPCLFAELHTDAKRKIITGYPQRLVQTPLEKLASLSPISVTCSPRLPCSICRIRLAP